MTPKIPNAFWLGVTSATVVAVALTAIFGGVLGLAGVLLGLVGSAFNLWALWAVIRLCGKLIETQKPEGRGTFIVVLAFFVKLPLFIVVGTLSYRLGGAAPACFLVGVALVYSALVGWVLAQS
jgi:hypothetical protein